MGRIRTKERQEITQASARTKMAYERGEAACAMWSASNRSASSIVFRVANVGYLILAILLVYGETIHKST